MFAVITPLLMTGALYVAAPFPTVPEPPLACQQPIRTSRARFRLALRSAERLKFSSFCAYSVLWSLLVYFPLVHWVWDDDGWLSKVCKHGLSV